MTGLSIRIGRDDVDAGLDRIDEAARDLSPVMSEISGYLVTATQRHIERERGPGGEPWPRLSPRTAEQRVRGRRRGYGTMLRVTARLYQSISGAHGSDYAEAGTNLAQAALLHFGGQVEHAARRQTIYQHYDEKTDTFDPRFRNPRRSNFARDVDVGAYTVTVPARPYVYVDDDEAVEIEHIAADVFGREIGAAP